MAAVRPDLRVSTRNARFQQWQALLDNRTKRTRSGEFLVQGVRPITQARQHDWPLRALLYPAGRTLSAWASGVLAETDAQRVEMAPELLAELAEKVSPPGNRPTGDGSVSAELVPELVAVAAQPADDLARIPVPADFLGVLFDRPASPGNLGTVIRSADAFGAHGVLVAGHAADPYDPRAVRASTGSLFALPVVRVPGVDPVLGRLAGAGVRVVGTDETGDRDIGEFDLTGPTLLVIGNETTGMSAAWRAACEHIVRIPIGGSASSLNASSAASVALYEAARQRKV